MLVVALVAQPALANPSHNAKDALDQGRTAYDRGDYGRAIDTINPAALSVDRARHRGRGGRGAQAARALVLLRQQAEGRGERGHVAVGAAAQLSARSHRRSAASPCASSRTCATANRSGSTRSRSASSRRPSGRASDEERRLAEARAKAERVYVDRVVEKHSRFIALLAVRRGAGAERADGQGDRVRRHRGRARRRRRSIALLHAAVSLSASIRRRATNSFPASDQNTATALISLQLAAGAAFWATVAWGIIDAQVLFKREVVRRHARTLARRRRRRRRASRNIPRSSFRRLAASVSWGHSECLAYASRCPARARRCYHLYKKITSIGSGEENDIVLPDPLLADTHAHVHFDGRDFNVTSIDKHGDLHVNGKKRKKHRLVHQDVMKIGSRRDDVLALRRAGHRRRSGQDDGGAQLLSQAVRVLREAARQATTCPSCSTRSWTRSSPSPTPTRAS